jgi:predicted ATPase
MATVAELVGRAHERAELSGALEACRNGQGGLVLIGGEAGVGKTRLAHEVVGFHSLLVLNGDATQQATPAYWPIVAALRSYLRRAPRGLDDCGPLTPYLGLLLPELGAGPPAADRATVLEALGHAFVATARDEPVVVVLDDLQWADDTTLTDVLPLLAGALEQERVLIIGVYRSDEIPRGHSLRRLRRELRRRGRLRELLLEPLDREGTSELAAGILGNAPSRALLAMLFDRTQGMPFFVEELAAALITPR